jgi:uncharacterized protein
MKVSNYENGVPCWTALAAVDPAGATNFYGPLFGWSPQDPATKDAMPDGHVLRGLAVAGIGPARNGVRSKWRPYISVVDAFEMTKKVAAAGGKIIRDLEIHPTGTSAILKDPSGAEFAIWQAGRGSGAALMQEPGTFAWTELIADDVQGAAAFYRMSLVGR